MSVNDIEIQPKVKHALRAAGIKSIEKLFCFSKLEIEKKTCLSEKDVGNLFMEAAKFTLARQATTAFDMLTGICDTSYVHRKLSTSCKSLDNMLFGGIMFPGITEVVGESSSGKTQLCMQLCIQASKSTAEGGLDAGSLYINAEDAFPIKRLQEMVKHNHCSNTKRTCIDITDKVFVEHTADLSDLLHLIERIPTLLQKKCVKLVVIDSIASLMRAEFSLDEMVERANALANIGSQLHQLSFDYGVCIVCVNQVTDVFDDDIHKLNLHGVKRVKPALGLIWANYVKTRIMLSRSMYTLSDVYHQKKELGQLVNSNELLPVGISDIKLRVAQVIFAPHLPKNECTFIITEKGVQDLPF